MKPEEGKPTALTVKIIQLEKITGIVKIRANMLRENGIADVIDFLKADESTLKKLLGVGEFTIKRMKSEGEKLLSS